MRKWVPAILAIFLAGSTYLPAQTTGPSGDAAGGSGTINTIPLWSTPTVLGDSIITESSGEISIAGILKVMTNTGGVALDIEENVGGENWQIGVDASGDLNFLDSGTNRVTVGDLNGFFGINDSNPQSLLDVGSGAGVVAWFNLAGEDGILVDPDVDLARIAVVGDVQAEFLLHHTGAPLDEKTARFILGDGSTRFEVLNDAFTTISHVSLDLSHATGLASLPSNIGAAPPAVCVAGAIFIDTDETDDTNCTTTADNSLCLCVATNTWVALENN